MKNLFTRFYSFCFVFMCFLPVQVMADDNKAIFSEAEFDQMLAPIALYPDSLLSQILMASTYPADVAEAVKWSKDNPDQEGDTAVTAVQDKSWDPSVMSLVAFPPVLEMMGKEAQWVQNLGDAFLASPEEVMDTVQKLRSKAKEEGNLETTKQQVVTVEQAEPQIIVIEPADPEVVYVPVYNPTIIYGTWWWPRYTPYYYYPPGYNFGSAVVAGIGFGVGIAITRSLWGNCNWRHRSVGINVNRYNSININNRINVNNRSTTWKHNNKNRRGVPYRDNRSRQQYNKKLSGSNTRRDYRGRDKASTRNTERQKAQNVLKQRGADPSSGRQKLSGSGGDNVRNQVKKIDRSQTGSKQNRASNNSNRAKGQAQNMNIDKRRNQAGTKANNRNSQLAQKRNKNNALTGIQKSDRTPRNISRGTSSNRSMGQSRGGGRAGGGGGRAGGGGGHRGR